MKKILLLCLFSLSLMAATPEEIIYRAEKRVNELAKTKTEFQEAEITWGEDPARVMLKRGTEWEFLDLRDGSLHPLHPAKQLESLFPSGKADIFLNRCLPGGVQAMTEKGGLWIPADGSPARWLKDEERLAFEAALAPRFEKRTRSKNAGGEAILHIRNTSGSAWKLAWIDFRGKANDYGQVAPGSWAHYGSFKGHAWQIQGERGEIIWSGKLPGDCLVTGKIAESAKKNEAAHAAAWRDISWNGGNPTDRGRALSSDASKKIGYWVVDFSDKENYLGFIRTEYVDKYQLSVIDTRPNNGGKSNSRTTDYNRAGEAIDKPAPFIVERSSGRRLEVPAERLQNLWETRILGIDEGLGKAWIYLHYRGHQKSSVIGLDLKTGAVQDLIDEQSQTFIDYSQKNLCQILPGGRELLWMSERDGWNHLYLYDLVSGSCRQITKGSFVVKKLDHYDAAGDWLYLKLVGADPKLDPYFEQLARCHRDGSGFAILTPENGEHDWSFSPDGKFIVDTWSRVDEPRHQVLRSVDGRLIRELAVENDAARRKLGWEPPKAFAFPGRDGKTLIYGIVYLPYPNSVQGQSPILEEIYAGPPGTNCPKNYHFVHNLEQLRAMGFAVVIIDGMGTNWRSKAFHDVCWHNLKDAGLPDRILWIRQMAKQFPSLDPTRVGIYGGSAGGQNAAGALIFHPEFYSAAFADCGCHDNRMDKIWWNEAWMGWPVGPWYSESSNIDQAAKLQGSLFLTGGVCDTNVDPLSTSKFAEALRQAGKSFDYTMLPGGTHCVGGWPEIEPRWKAFFIEKLLLGGSDAEIAKFRDSRAELVKKLAPLDPPPPAPVASVEVPATPAPQDNRLLLAATASLIVALIGVIYLLINKLKPKTKTPSRKRRPPGS